jgi:hypothetical protein
VPAVPEVVVPAVPPVLDVLVRVPLDADESNVPPSVSDTSSKSGLIFAQPDAKNITEIQVDTLMRCFMSWLAKE